MEEEDSKMTGQRVERKPVTGELYVQKILRLNVLYKVKQLTTSRTSLTEMLKVFFSRR
jgi:hypothetical protein